MSPPWCHHKASATAIPGGGSRQRKEKKVESFTVGRKIGSPGISLRHTTINKITLFCFHSFLEMEQSRYWHLNNQLLSLTN